MQTFEQILTDVLTETQVPSLAAAVIKDGRVQEAGAVGVRKQGTDTPVTANDNYHIGSCAKAITASVAAILIDRSELGWDTTLRQVFPDLPMHPDFERVTLTQLLSHSSGLPALTKPADEPEDLLDLVFTDEAADMRYRHQTLAPALLRDPPRYAPGSQTVYSNAGYILVGVILEKLTGMPFESLIEREYFAPLGIKTGGFGAPGTAGRVDQPYGHLPEPVEPGLDADNPPALSAAGRAHMSIGDFARHAAFHLTGSPGLLNRATLERLHEPRVDTYACGWNVFEVPWAGGVILQHAGTNLRWFSLVVLVPGKNFGLVYATNIEPDQGEGACVKVFRVLRSRYL